MDDTVGPSQNRQALADMTKQFLLIIVSLSLSFAFEIFKPLKQNEDGGLSIAYLYRAIMTPYNYVYYSIFFVYVLVCVKYLAIHWLYLSKLYPAGSPLPIEDNRRTHEQTHERRHMLWEVFGVLFTGIVLGVQSCYVAKTMPFGFSALFACILLFDVITSLSSRHRNRRASLLRTERTDIAYSTANDATFCLICILLLLWAGWIEQPEPTDPPYLLLLLSVSVNCILSLVITAQSYFVNPSERWDRVSARGVGSG